MKNIFGILSFLLLTFSLTAEILKDRHGKPVRFAGRFSDAPVVLPDRYREHNVEFRGVWCVTSFNIDFPRCATAAEFKKQFRNMVLLLKKMNCNALIFQLRGNCDAFYKSKINPYSRFLTGKEGRGYAGFDPLPYMVAETHRLGLEFHAWLNPYRISGATKLNKWDYLATLAPENFAAQHPEYVLEYSAGDGKRGLLLNPGEPAVRNHLLATVLEILRAAPVDAIHFDDYFYPYVSIGNADLKSFLTCNPGKLSIAAWRRSNNDALIRAVGNLCRSRHVRFGVSPFGIWANSKDLKGGSLTAGHQSYSELYADTLRWLQAGWVDYLIPQLYWSFDDSHAGYAAILSWWATVARCNPKVKLYIGHGLYKISAAELANQLRFNQKYPIIYGESLYSARQLKDPKTQAVLRRFWTKNIPAQQPWKPKKKAK